MDRVNGSNFASYLKSLVEWTPSARNRLEVVQGQPTIHVLNESHPILSAPNTRSDLSETFRRCCEGDLPHQTTAQVQGYSSDDNWVLESRFTPMGMTGYTSAVVSLHSLGSGRTVDYELFGDKDIIPGAFDPGSFVPCDLNGRIEKILAAVERIGFSKPQVLYCAPERVSVDEFSGPPIFLSLGKETFEIGIDTDGIRQALFLKNHRFRPPRTAQLLFERIERISDPDLDIQLSIYARPFAGIMAITASPSGKLISIVLTTNAENGCWGHPEIHILHLQLEKLRDQCREALL